MVPKRIQWKDTRNIKQIAYAQHKEGYAICYIMNTDHGIITAHAATKKHVGGVPLIKVL